MSFVLNSKVITAEWSLQQGEFFWSFWAQLSFACFFLKSLVYVSRCMCVCVCVFIGLSWGLRDYLSEFFLGFVLASFPPRSNVIPTLMWPLFTPLRSISPPTRWIYPLVEITRKSHVECNVSESCRYFGEFGCFAGREIFPSRRCSALLPGFDQSSSHQGGVGDKSAVKTREWPGLQKWHRVTINVSKTGMDEVEPYEK